MKKFIIIGANGYIGKRHIDAIHHVGGELIAICDPNENAGYLDKYYDNVEYFKEIEMLDRFLEDNQADYFVVCTPNYLHYSHIKFGLLHDMDVICEKPLVLDYKDIDNLIMLENQTGKKIYPVLQARLHPEIQKLKKMIDPEKTYKVDCLYASKRSDWYKKTWKGDVNKAGGVVLNIGIHLFDVLFYLFGVMTGLARMDNCGWREMSMGSGVLHLHRADIKFKVSIRKKDIPEGKNVIRLLQIEGIGDIEFSKDFFKLHGLLYEKIIKGEWNINIKNLETEINLAQSNEFF